MAGLGLQVCTVGRLLDHLNKNSARLRERLAHLHVLVLDEGAHAPNTLQVRWPAPKKWLPVVWTADTLLHTSFRREVAEVLKFLPPSEQRQTLLFSATVPSAIPVVRASFFSSAMLFAGGRADFSLGLCRKV